MQKHQTFPPIVNLLLLRAEAADWPEILRLIVVDLALRNVIVLSVQEEKSLLFGRISKEIYVRLGAFHKGYAPQPEEQSFLKRIPQNGNSILLRKVLRLMLGDSPYGSSLFRLVIRQPAYKHLFVESFWRKLLGGFVLSPSGRAELDSLKAKLNEDFARFTRMRQERPSQLPSLFQALTANALLLPDFDVKSLTAWCNPVYSQGPEALVGIVDPFDFRLLVLLSQTIQAAKESYENENTSD